MEPAEQLSIFDLDDDIFDIPEVNEPRIKKVPITQKELSFQVDEIVVINKEKLDEENIINYYYLINFINKKGIVRKVIKQPTLQYEVEFGHNIAMIYHEELSIFKGTK